MVQPGSALPFIVRRSDDVYSWSEFTTTIEKMHGVLRLEAEELVVQWGTARETQRYGMVTKTDRALDPVREVRIPLAGLAGAEFRWQWLNWPPGPAFILRAADLHAFEGLAGHAALTLDHPAEVVLGIRRRDRALAREFAADLEMHLADRALATAERHDRLDAGRTRRATRGIESGGGA